MGIVRGDHKTIRQMDQVIFLCVSQTAVYPCERVVQESGCSSLLCFTSYFFIIQYAEDGHVRAGTMPLGLFRSSCGLAYSGCSCKET